MTKMGNKHSGIIKKQRGHILNRQAQEAIQVKARVGCAKLCNVVLPLMMLLNIKIHLNLICFHQKLRVF